MMNENTKSEWTAAFTWTLLRETAEQCRQRAGISPEQTLGQLSWNMDKGKRNVAKKIYLKKLFFLFYKKKNYNHNLEC